MKKRNIAASIRAKLLTKARAEKLDFNLILTRYALERLLYRLSVSAHSGQFLLKGALLFDLWFDVPHRPTRDADLLGFGSDEVPDIEEVFRDICALELDDGIHFLPESVRANTIRKESSYSGVRVLLLGLLSGAHCSVQVDVGFGDAITPGPETVNYPTLLPGLPSPTLRAYPRYTVVAEKFQAMVVLGAANSRMKDYFDLLILSRHSNFNGDLLCQAIRATFERRSTPAPSGIPYGLSGEFALDSQKQVQWRAFLKKNALSHMELDEVIHALQLFLLPPLEVLRGKEVDTQMEWLSGSGWTR